MSRAQAHRFWIEPWNNPLAAEGWQGAVMVSIDPPLPQGDRMLANFGAQTEGHARAELKGLKLPRGHRLMELTPHHFILEWEPVGEAEGRRWELTARTHSQLIAFLVGAVVHEQSSPANVVTALMQDIWGKAEQTQVQLKELGTWTLCSKSVAR